MIVESVNSLERLPGALRQLGSLPKLLCSEEEFIKTEHVQNGINLFREKVIALFDKKLMIYNNQFTLDNAFVASNIAFFNVPIESNIDKTTRPKYIITDGGNYDHSQSKKTRLRCGSIILDESFHLSAFSLSSGNTDIQSHNVHEQYACVDALACLDSVYKDHRSEQLIWISDLSPDRAKIFFDNNEIKNIDFLSRNSLTKNFAYIVFIKGIIDKLLHKEDIFNKISSATFKKQNIIKNYIIKGEESIMSTENTIIQNPQENNTIPKIEEASNQYPDNTISIKNIPVVFVDDFKHKGSLHVEKIGNTHQALFHGLEVSDEIIVEKCDIIQLSSMTITTHTLKLINLENLEIIAQTLNAEILIIENCPKLITKDIINLYPNVKRFNITR